LTEKQQRFLGALEFDFDRLEEAAYLTEELFSA